MNVDVAGGQQLLGDRRQVIPAALSPCCEAGLADRLGDALGGPAVDGEHALDVGVGRRRRSRPSPAPPGNAAPVVTTWTLIPGCDFSVAWAPSIRGWMFSDPGVAMNSATSPDGTSEAMCSSHLLAGDEQVLPDVGQARACRRVGVVGDDGNLRRQRLGDRAVERLEVHQRDADAVDAGGDRAVEGVDHLADVARLRAGPLIRAPQQLAGVGGAVLRGREERVRRDVVDQRELQLGADTEDARGGAGAARRPPRRCRSGARTGAGARAAARLDHQRGDPGRTTCQRCAASELPQTLVRRVLLLALVPLESLDGVVDNILLGHLSPLLGPPSPPYRFRRQAGCPVKLTQTECVVARAAGCSSAWRGYGIAIDDRRGCPLS